MKYIKDGDQLCIMNDDFINLQESKAIFLDYDNPITKRIMKLIDENFTKECTSCLSENIQKREIGYRCLECGSDFYVNLRRVYNKKVEEILEIRDNAMKLVESEE